MKFKTTISRLLVIIMTMSLITFIPAEKASADAFKVVTLGANLTDKQKEDMLKYFKVKKEEANILEVTKDEEEKYLAGVASKKQIGTRSISCSYVEPTDKGGLNISTHNIYWVTKNMIKNALITAGIENATVKAAAPFNVSGTAALTGILKGFENSKGGKKIDENKKKAANEELIVTGELGEKIGQDDAANLINEAKKDVIKEKPKTKKQIQKIVEDATDNYGEKLSNEDIEKITALMDKINGLDLDFKQLKNQLNEVTNQLKDKVTSEEAKGFFAKVWDSISNFFSDVFSKDDENSENDSENSTDNTNSEEETTTNNEE